MVEYRIPEMITLKEAASRTGLSYDCLRKLCLTSRIVFFRSGAKYMINYPKLVDFLNNGGEADEQI